MTKEEALDRNTKNKGAPKWRAYNRAFKAAYGRESDGFEFAPNIMRIVDVTLDEVAKGLDGFTEYEGVKSGILSPLP